MMIELLCRYKKDLTKEELATLKEELQMRRTIQGDDINEEMIFSELFPERETHEYGPMVINTKDIFCFNKVDEDHTCIRYFNGSMFNVKVAYDSFLQIYQTTTGSIIQSLIATEEE